MGDRIIGARSVKGARCAGASIGALLTVVLVGCEETLLPEMLEG